MRRLDLMYEYQPVVYYIALDNITQPVKEYSACVNILCRLYALWDAVLYRICGMLWRSTSVCAAAHHRRRRCSRPRSRPRPHPVPLQPPILVHSRSHNPSQSRHKPCTWVHVTRIRQDQASKISRSFIVITSSSQARNSRAYR